MGESKGEVLRRAATFLPHLAVVPAAAGAALLAAAGSATTAILGTGLLLLALAATLLGTFDTWRRGRALRRLVHWAREVESDLGTRPPLPGPVPELTLLSNALQGMARRVGRANRRLVRSERRIRELLESMSEGFLVVDAKERITYANQGFSKMLGAPAESLVGLELKCFLDAENQQRLLKETDDRREGRSGRYELEWCRPDGGRLSTQVSACPIRNGRGLYRGAFGVVTDLTERKRLEHQMTRTEKFRALGELAGGVAHDFNNRLTAILGNAQLLLLDEPEEEIAGPLRVIESAALEGAETVRRIMEFSRTKPGTTRVDVRVDEFIDEVLDLLRFREEMRSGQHRIRRDLKATRAVSGSPGELREAFLNVCVNALDAMPEGGDIEVRTRNREGGVEIRVTDTGHGMDAETANRALDPFFTTRGTRRSGLGLPLAWGILERHGGRIRIRSAVERGTAVSILLPGVEAPAETATPTAPAPGGPGRALVVEPDEETLRRLRFGLGREGFVVDAAADGVEAIERIRDGSRYDVLVAELALPGVPGDRVAEEARKGNPGLRVVYLADAETNGRTDARGDGHLIEKPFVLPDLLTALEVPKPGR